MVNKFYISPFKNYILYIVLMFVIDNGRVNVGAEKLRCPLILSDESS